MKKHTKLKLAVIISIVSIIITILSLSFSVYTGLKNIEYQDNIKRIQQNTQQLQTNSMQFEESYKKISLIEQSVTDRINTCSEVNKAELNNDLKLLTDARTALINNDYPSVSTNLNNINLEDICNTELKTNSVYIELGILGFIWLLLIITLIKVTRR
jgi:biopolymer transport protein ExbB/TolQ